MCAFDLQHEIDNTTSGIIQLPYGEVVRADDLVIGRDVLIQGATMTSHQLKCKSIKVTSRGAVRLANFRLTSQTAGAPVGVHFDYAFNSSMERVLVEGFNLPAQIRAGNCWDITRCRLDGLRHAVEVNNIENGDEGDWSIFGTTMACTDNSQGISAVLVESSGGGRMVDCKALGFKWSVLLQTRCVSSVMLIAACSFEGYSEMAISGRVVEGSYDKVAIGVCEFASDVGGGITMDGVDRVAVSTCVTSIKKPFYQSVRMANKAIGGGNV